MMLEKLDKGIVHTYINYICSLYGAGSSKIAEEISKNGEYISAREASIIINNYFKRFPQLKHWIDSNKEFITNSGFIYSFFGRKRRLPEVFVEDKGAQGHAIRSGLNFLVQSVASDINLLGAIEANSAIKKTGMDANIFALVHDSILADVAEDCVDSYVTLIRDCIQRDRGLSIVGCPISCDFDVADDYALGKFEKYVSEHYLQKSA